MMRVARVLAGLLILVGSATATTPPPTVPVTFLIEGPGGTTLNTSSSQLKIKPHLPFRITASTGEYWLIPAYEQTITVTSTTGDQIILLHPNLAGATSYTISPETYYEYRWTGYSGTGATSGKVQTTAGSANVEWGEIHIDDDEAVNSTAYLLPTDVISGTGIDVGIEGGSVRITNTGPGSGTLTGIGAGVAVQIGGTSAVPIVSVDSGAITPSYSNVQGAPANTVQSVQPGVAVQIGGTSTAPIVSVDSGAVTPSWSNIQGAPASVVEGVDPGVAVQIGGTSTRPSVSVDSGAVTPSYSNVQGRPGNTVEGLDAGVSTQVGGTSTRPVVNVDSSTVTPSWTNVQGRPSPVESLQNGVATVIGGTSTSPLVNVDSAAVTPSYSNLQGGLTTGIATQIAGTSNAVQVNVDSGAITPTWSNIQGAPANTVLGIDPGLSTQVAGTSTRPSINVDSATITPSYANIIGGLVDGLSTQVAGTSSAPSINVDSSNLTPSYARLQGGLAAGIATQVTGTSGAPQVNVDSSAITPTYSNLQGGIVAGLSTQVGGTSNAVAINVDSATITPSYEKIVGGLVAGLSTQVAGTSSAPSINVDSATITPSYSKLQGGLVAGVGTSIGGTSNAPQVDVDSGAITPTWTNVQGRPSAFIEGVDAGVAVQIGGTSTRPIVSVDSGAITPSYSNLQGGIAAGIATQVSGTSNAPQVNVDSGAVTPSYANLQGGLAAGTSTQVAGTSGAPQVNVDSANLTPSYARLQGGLVDGTSTQIAGTSDAPKVNVDSGNLTPTYAKLQGGLVNGVGTSVGGTSNAPSVDVDSATITPTYANIQSKPAAFPIIVQEEGSGTDVATTINVSSLMAGFVADVPGTLATLSITPTTFMKNGVPFAQPSHINFVGTANATVDSAGILNLELGSGGSGSGSASGDVLPLWDARRNDSFTALASSTVGVSYTTADSGAEHIDLTGGVVTIPEDGYYLVSFKTTSVLTASAQTQLFLYRNATVIEWRYQAGTEYVDVSVPVSCTAGDVLNVSVTAASDSYSTWTADAGYATRFFGYRLPDTELAGAGGGTAVGGDLAGSTTNATVSGLEGYDMTYPSTPPSDGMVWAYDSSTGKFTLEAQSGGGGASTDANLGFYDHLHVHRTAANTVNVSANYIVLSADGANSSAHSIVNENIDISASVGAGGPDEASLDTSSRWLSLWLIAKADGTIDGLVSDDTESPDMPSGYTTKFRVGWVRNDSSSNFVDYFQDGTDVTFLWETYSTGRVLSGGTSTSFATVSAASFAPPTAHRLLATGSMTGVSGESWMRVRYPGSTAHIVPIQYFGATGVTSTLQWPWVPVWLNASIEFQYQINGGSANMDVVGYIDRIGEWPFD